MKFYIGGSYPVKFKPFAWLIRIYTGNPSSHIYGKYQDAVTEQWLIEESSHGEAHKMTVENWLVHNDIKEEYCIECDKELFKEILTRINSRLQTKYSIKNVFGVPLYDAFEKTGLAVFAFLANLFSDGISATICSESASYTLGMIGIYFDRPNDFIRPDQVLKRLEEAAKTEDYVMRSI